MTWKSDHTEQNVVKDLPTSRPLTQQAPLGQLPPTDLARHRFLTLPYPDSMLLKSTDLVAGIKLPAQRLA